MWKNEKDNDREKRRVRGRKRREREIERRKKSARKREENKTPHASRGITSCIYAGGFFCGSDCYDCHFCGNWRKGACFCGWAFDCNLFRSMDGSDLPDFGDYKERDKNYVTCKIGVACNLAILACFVGIFIRGLL